MYLRVVERQTWRRLMCLWLRPFRHEAFVFYAFPNRAAVPKDRNIPVAPLCFKQSKSKPVHVEIDMAESCDSPGLWKQMFVLFAKPLGTVPQVSCCHLASNHVLF